MKQLMILCVLCLLLSSNLVLSKDEPGVELAQQQKLLNSALDQYDSQAKAKMLLPFLVNPFPEIKDAALKALKELPACYKLNPVLEVLPVKAPPLREYASAALGNFGAEEAITSLFQAVLNDPYEQVRQNALNSLLKLTTKEKLINRFSNVLKDENCGPYHIRAAGALGLIGRYNDQATVHLIERLEVILTWGSGPRVHVFFGKNTSYVQDLEVIASQQAIAYEPIIKTLFSGVCLDVKVVRVQEFITIERQIICRALANITAKDFGEDNQQWVKWWSQERGKPLTQRYREQKADIEKSEADRTENDIDIEKRLGLATWCWTQKQEKKAVRELATLLTKIPDNTLALNNLKQMGYGLYQDQWRPLDQIFLLQEKSVYDLLNQLKFYSYETKKREEALARLDKTELIYKMRPFIKVLQIDPVDSMRSYAAQELAEIKEPKAIPYLVKASLIDRSETVRTNAFNSVKQIGTKESIPWYIYFLESNPGASTTIRASEILGEIGTRDQRTIIALLRCLYQLNLKPKATKNIPAPTLPKMFTLDTDKKEKLLLGTVKIEMPDIKLTDIKIEEQLKTVGKTLARVTGQAFGSDYEQWISWWQKYNSKK